MHRLALAVRLPVRQVRFASNFGVAAAAAANPMLAAMPVADRVWFDVNTASRERLSALAGPKGFDAAAALSARQSAAKGVEPKGVTLTKSPKDQLANAKSAAEFFGVYTAILAKVATIAAEREGLQLHLYGYNDVLNLGLKAGTQEKLNKTKVLRDDAVKKIAELDAQKAAFVSSALSTALFNDLMNVVRCCSSDADVGNQLATQLMDDMTLCGVAPDSVTEVLIRNILFQDGPHEDSGLLFEFVEQPLLSEISVAKVTDAKTVEAVADAALKAVSKRHDEPLTGGDVVRRQDTFPQLQFSPE